MQNQEWVFNDILFFSSHNSVPVYNHGGEAVGLLERADAKSIDVNTDHMRTGDAYRFKDTHGRTRMAMGVKKARCTAASAIITCFSLAAEQQKLSCGIKYFFHIFAFTLKGVLTMNSSKFSRTATSS
ncbi:hypothetical protein CHL76_01025 [Marinococcus halophilus]|uniref:Uncharacterized protein n=1 Tax=Marinococcus halophilus TaxID=1371 RepID=A0A510Y2X0_MARHA|nr:hypothetical protein [Marinococcus halophilus]OZT81709.1 hypothetical protein CHL76_01025 [Marinococcus halophilus]GEK57662.1 hypothetical protein MHA01_05670 [Marinococcus halophilus]